MPGFGIRLLYSLCENFHTLKSSIIRESTVAFHLLTRRHDLKQSSNSICCHTRFPDIRAKWRTFRGLMTQWSWIFLRFQVIQRITTLHCSVPTPLSTPTEHDIARHLLNRPIRYARSNVILRCQALRGTQSPSPEISWQPPIVGIRINRTSR